LWVQSWDGLAPLDLDLTPAERLVRGINSAAGALWVATRAGLLCVWREAGSLTVVRRHAAPIVELRSTAHGLAFLTTDGAYLLTSAGDLRQRSGPFSGREAKDVSTEVFGPKGEPDDVSLARRISGY
jgi:hypothetical protein